MNGKGGRTIKIFLIVVYFLILAAVGIKLDVSYALEYSEQSGQIFVKVGQDFVIKLESNPTTGYEWQLERPLDERVVTLVGSEYKRMPFKMLGSGGMEYWTFKAVGKGRARIILQYVRPWEKREFSKKERVFIVVVR